MKLFIVESPNKIKSIRGYLNAIEPGAWEVAATVGHWRGLPSMKGKVFSDVADPEDGFKENFAILEGKEDAARRLEGLVGRASGVYLASDDDREGEAISWHIEDHFGLSSAVRVRCHEITKAGIEKALEEATTTDNGLVAAQRARSLLDYLIGMEVSRMLWRFGARSAGRLQSCALRIVVEREVEIENFKAKPYWTLHVDYSDGFSASVCVEEKSDDEESSERPTIWVPKKFDSKEEADRFLKIANNEDHVVVEVEKKRAKRNPPAPFTTSSLLGSAATELKFPAKKTTSVAQVLFEKGAITYIRTDSVTLADEAIAEIRKVIDENYPDAVSEKPVEHKNKTGAQAAHEAIRPTDLLNRPTGLNRDEESVYDLIVARTLASQCRPAEFDKTVISIQPGKESWRLRASGSVIKQPGWMSVWGRARTEDSVLPDISKDLRLSVSKCSVKESKTKSPARFTEQALIKYLESRGIGRPSTYSSMITTLTDRDYVSRKKSFLIPEELGRVADGLVKIGFEELSNEKFTAQTERALDGVANGKISREEFLAAFYGKFQRMRARAVKLFANFAEANPDLDKYAVKEHGEPCSKCEGRMLVRSGKYGPYARCADEECGHTVNLSPPEIIKIPCEICAGKVEKKKYKKGGKSKTFFTCLSCDWSSDFAPAKVSKWPCHRDPKHGKMLEKRFKKKDGTKVSCFECQTCKFSTYDGPKPPSCPKCGGRMRGCKSAKGGFFGCAQYPKCDGAVFPKK